MKQAKTILSTYTADVSGVCSALFELGGMTVMHDASGCNSTYNTHDEPRWYDHDSLVFISALSEMEAIMGDDSKLVSDLIDTANKLKPNFVAVAGTPIPMLTGCDLQAIAFQVEEATGIPAFGFNTNGMRSYVLGAGEALSRWGERFCDRAAVRKTGRMNILGATPLDFSVVGITESMKAAAEKAGWKVISTWAMGSTPEEMKQAGEAEVNLVVSGVGLPAARMLQKLFGTPYVVGTPCGEAFNAKLFSALSESAADGKSRTVFADYIPAADAELLILGESVTARSLASAIHLTYGKEVKVICTLETEAGILSANDLHYAEEEDIFSALKGAKGVIADPMFKPAVPEGCTFYALPHEGCSGRIWRKQIPDLVDRL